MTSPGENAVGLSIICGDCGTLTAGVEAGDKVRWVRCASCQAGDTALLDWLLAQPGIANLVYDWGWRADVEPAAPVRDQLLGWRRATERTS